MTATPETQSPAGGRGSELKHALVRAQADSTAAALALHLARADGDVTDTLMRPWRLPWGELVRVLAEPTPGDKGGAYFVRGRCLGTRGDLAMATAADLLLIVDGDTKMDPATGAEPEKITREGSTKADYALPCVDPRAVHDVLTRAGVAHVIYTSHSHCKYGPDWHKWRLIVPSNATPATLTRATDAVLGLLWDAGLHVWPVDECYRLSQPWYLPRVAADRADTFWCAHHDGRPFDVDTLPPVRKPPPPPAKTSATGPSVIDAFNAAHDAGAILEAHGYKRMGSRYLPPSSTSGIPGVKLLDDGRVYCHNGSDKLGDGKSHDAFDLFRILDHGGDFSSALSAARRALGWPDRTPPPKGASAAPDGEGKQAADSATLRVSSVADLASVSDAPAPCVVASLIPRGVVTLGGAHGGIGKTTLAAVLTAHCAAGRQWGPFQCEQGRVLFVSLEDPAARVWALLRRAAEHYGLDPAEVSRSVVILDGSAAEDSALAVEVSEAGVRRLLPTAAYAELLERAAGFDLIVIDNASDAFDGDENNRRMVRRFVRGMLGTIARSHDCGLLLLAHVDKSAARYGAKGNSYSGSTGWHNSARSRLAIVENEAGTLELIHEKANLGKRAETVRLQWSAAGMLEPVASGNDAASGAAALIEGADAEIVLGAIRAAIEAGADVPTARLGSVTTYTMLATFDALPKQLRPPQGRARFWGALDRLRRDGRIESESYTTRSRHQRQRWIVKACAE